MPSKIDWTDETWNPVTGCTKISPGCAHCYAENIAKRFWGSRPFSEIRCHEDRLGQPLRWRKPRRVFVCSMSDLFHPDVHGMFRLRVFGIMHQAAQHTFQVLTKRPEGLQHFVNEHGLWPEEDTRSPWFGTTPCGEDWPLPNVHIGVSAEDQATARLRIPKLTETPLGVRWVSVEPMLGPVNLMPQLSALDWVVCGCESGPGARPMEIDWVRVLRDQCIETNTPFYLKQMMVDGKLRKMPELDGRVWDQQPTL